MSPTSGPGTAVRRTEVDGVPALWADLAVDPVTTLFFGAGYEDTAPAAAGITHLVEHLVMRRVGRVRYTVNAESTLRSTSFFVVGTPDQTVDFLARVCAAVRDLADVRDEDLEAERRTILTEIGGPGIYATADPLSVRFGPHGVGAPVVTHARLLDWTADEVRATARTWFHAGNAALVSTRPLPEGVRLDLPPARPVERAPVPEPVLDGRVWAELPYPAVQLSGLVGVADGVTRQLASFVLSDVLRESLRAATGDVYSVEAQGLLLDAHREVVGIDLDPEPDRLLDVLGRALDVVDRLATDGPTADELDFTRDVAVHELSLASVQAGWLDTAASHLLRGIPLPSPDELRLALPTITPDDVREVVADLAASLLVVVPAGVVDPRELTERLGAAKIRPLDEVRASGARPRGGRRFRGKLWGPARGVTLSVLPDRLVIEDRTAVFTLRAENIVLAGTDRDGDHELVTAHGEAWLISPGHFHGLATPLARFLDALPAHVRYRKSRPQDELPDAPAPEA
jgi:predicted Zn-dependent peptidase